MSMEDWGQGWLDLEMDVEQSVQHFKEIMKLFRDGDPMWDVDDLKAAEAKVRERLQNWILEMRMILERAEGLT
jgi:hypothetical protein